MRKGAEQVVSIGRTLSHHALDTAVRSASLYRQAGWASPNNVIFDMEALEYADFGAAARFVVLAEGLVRRGFEIQLVLPNPEIRVGEQDFLNDKLSSLPLSQRDSVQHNLESRVEQRRRVRGFLRHIGFLSALQFTHLPKKAQALLTVSDQGRRSSASELPTLLLGSSVREYPAIVPFRWLGAFDLQQTQRWQVETIKVLFDQGVVMTRNDAESLVMTVLHELVENVKDHAPDNVSDPPGALFGAITLNRERSRYHAKTDHFYDSATPYLTWLGDQRSPIARIVVADSGVGLPDTVMPLILAKTETLSPSERNLAAIRYSFRSTISRHGSGHRRGVGLTTVRRFVRSYGGMITVRARNVSGGYEFSTRTPTVIEDQRLAYVPGTSIETFLGLTLRTRIEHERTGVVDNGAGDIVPIVTSFDDTVNSLRTTIETVIEDKSAQLPIVVLMIDAWKRDRDSGQAFALKLGKLAAAVSGIAGIAVVLAGASDADCEATFGAIDEIRESSDSSWRKRWDMPSWWPPFLVLSASGRSRWAGGSKALRGLLYKMLEGAVAGIESLPVDGLTSQDVSYLRTERDWFRVQEGQAGLRVTPSQIDMAVAADVATRLSLNIKNAHLSIAGS